MGDRINKELEMLEILYNLKIDEENNNSLIKIKITLISAICEAILYDFINTRINTYTQEGVDQINKEYLIKIRSKNYKKFHHYIDAAIKYEFFPKSTQLCEKLKELKGLRNCIHIQNNCSLSDKNLILAEETLELFLDEMAKHGRPEHTIGHVQDFKIPFDRCNLLKENL